MGEVYRGRDTRLDRQVAIKIVIANRAGAAETRERFQREARAISRLAHPHICTLFDVGHQDGSDYLVMEYLEGTTLADRIAKGPLPLADALRYGSEIADALDVAHRAGIVHRDLKPGNIMLTRSGVKVLDFGLAKHLEQSGGEASVDSPTAQQPLTREGMIVGTVQYMAPEQLEGRDADARTDIFALGAILYEMATARRPFQGASTVALIGSIMHEDPPPLADLPADFSRVVRKCLAKDPEVRWQSARDLASELRWIGEAPATAAPAPKRARAWLLVATAIASLLALGLFVAVWLVRKGANAPPVIGRFQIRMPEHSVLSPFSGPAVISPDGKMVAFFTTTEGRYLLWLRPLASLEAKPLQGSDGGSFPFWSPDSRRIGFFAEHKLKVIGIDGGSPQIVCDAPQLSTAAWNHDGVIIFGSAGSGLVRVAAAGGRPEPLTAIDRAGGEIAHLWPSFLPDGRHYLYLSKASDPNGSAIRLGTLGSKETAQLVSADSNAIYSAPGFLLYSVEGKLVAAPFDLARKSVGPPRTIAESVWGFRASGGSLFSASENGILLYATPAVIRTKLAWFNRAGQELNHLTPAGEAVHVALSPAGDRLMFESIDESTGNGGIWLHDIARGVTSRLTFERTWTDFPTWFRDGRQIAYGGLTGTGTSVEAAAADGSGPSRVLTTSNDLLHPMDVGASGAVLYGRLDPVNRDDLWVLPAGGEARPFIATPFDETQAQFSPDEHWVAYCSNESGRLEVYVRSYPAADRKIAISTNGGSEPRWSHDGRELFYISADDELIAVTIKPGAQLEPGGSRALFKVSPIRYFGRFDYDVDPKSERFVVNTRVSTSGAEVVAVTNWVADLHK